MNYLEKHAFYPQKIFEVPEKDLGIVIVIPAFREPGLLHSLQSLKDCTKPQCAAEVILVINQSIDADEETKQITNTMIVKADDWISGNKDKRLKYYVIAAPDLPVKTGGVGLARKIGMDEAVRRLERSGNPRGIICCFDADSSCDTNYLTEVEAHFKSNSKATGCSVYFEHPLHGNSFSSRVYEGIMHYELHLRYYISGLRYAGHPFAYHTIGSSMAVRADIYQKQGGMNKRKAGEDFYFLHKIIPLGNFTELNTTRIIPSPRPSDRVPFGTGKAIRKWVENKNNIFLTYHPEVFETLKLFLLKVDDFYHHSGKEEDLFRDLPQNVISFMQNNDFIKKNAEIKENSTGIISYRKRFYNWFDGFRTLKFIHHLRDNHYEDCNIKEATATLIRKMHMPLTASPHLEDIIKVYRKADKLTVDIDKRGQVLFSET